MKLPIYAGIFFPATWYSTTAILADMSQKLHHTVENIGNLMLMDTERKRNIGLSPHEMEWIIIGLKIILENDREKRILHPALEGWGSLTSEALQMMRNLIERLNLELEKKQ